MGFMRITVWFIDLCKLNGSVLFWRFQDLNGANGVIVIMKSTDFFLVHRWVDSVI